MLALYNILQMAHDSQGLLSLAHKLEDVQVVRILCHFDPKVAMVANPPEMGGRLPECN